MWRICSSVWADVTKNRRRAFSSSTAGYGTSRTSGHLPNKLQRGTGTLGAGALWNVHDERTYVRLQVRDDYFRAYTRVIWLAQQRTEVLEEAAQHAADLLGLPLEVVDVGETGLEAQIERLVA